MARVIARSYVSPTLVLLAFDWPEGPTHQDFLGFAIKRTPGFWLPDRTKRHESSWLPNKLGFDGPLQIAGPSNENPIQKFQWWDAQIDDEDSGQTFIYLIAPVLGTADQPRVRSRSGATVGVTLPPAVEHGIGTWFNRAVVSSQSFSRQFGERVDPPELDRALRWLSNGMHRVVPRFLDGSSEVEGAIYHLTDKRWIFPAFERFDGPISMVIDEDTKDNSNDPARDQLDPPVEFEARKRANIMHDKFLVRTSSGRPTGLLTGSANFTTEALSVQANLIHTFRSAKLADLYLARKHLLADDPTVGTTAKGAAWSDPIRVGDASVRVFFSPEPKKSRICLDTVVQAVRETHGSLFFCLFKPTDTALLDAMMAAGANGKAMFGLVNALPKGEAADAEPSDKPRVEVFEHGLRAPGIVDHRAFTRGDQPWGFWWENSTIPLLGETHPVWIHHKFVIVDPQSDAPVIYTGSANMSDNSLHRNDENLLEITGSPRLAAIYVAEFLRLYEHYRARAVWGRWKKKNRPETYRLQKDVRWTRKYFDPENGASRARTALARPAST